MMIPRVYKETIRYLIILVVMWFTRDMSLKAYELEAAGHLTTQFAGIVASVYATLTLVLKFIFETKVSSE